MSFGGRCVVGHHGGRCFTWPFRSDWVDLSKLDAVMQSCLAAIHGICHGGRLLARRTEKARTTKQRVKKVEKIMEEATRQ